MRTNLRRAALAAVAVVVAVAMAVAWLVASNDDEQRTAPRPPEPTGVPERPEPDGTGGDDGVVVVKVDNAAAARPQSGLAAADVVYVEPVEGGYTRLAAVYSAHWPDSVGPVRSARESDVELLSQYGRPSLVYSGSAPEIEEVLGASGDVLVTPGVEREAFSRAPERPAPHNLYAHPGQVPRGSGVGPQRVYEFGAAPGAGGRDTASHTVRFEHGTYTFDWSADEGRWRVTLDGAAVESTGTGPVTAATVVVQRVVVESGAGVHDTAGSPSPVARTVGEGPATVLRDGRVFEGTWSRSAPDEGTRFTTGSGQPARLADGPVWVLLVPH